MYNQQRLQAVSHTSTYGSYVILCILNESTSSRRSENIDIKQAKEHKVIHDDAGDTRHEPNNFYGDIILKSACIIYIISLRLQVLLADRLKPWR